MSYRLRSRSTAPSGGSAFAKHAIPSPPRGNQSEMYPFVHRKAVVRIHPKFFLDTPSVLGTSVDAPEGQELLVLLS